MIRDFQNGNKEIFVEIHQSFKPLIIAWLRQTKEYYQLEREDYESMAKIILMECCMNYQAERGVPFASYYKIKLYNWYGNYKKKKRIITEQISDEGAPNEEKKYKLEREMFLGAVKTLKETDREILLLLCKGYSHDQIAKALGLTKKTVMNKKYLAIRELKKIIG